MEEVIMNYVYSYLELKEVGHDSSEVCQDS